jgi:CheY-like chemotaxis protein
MSTNEEGAALARPLDGIYVLVVEDYEDARTLYTLLLTMSGAQVTAVGSVAEALEALERTRFDAIASDVNMPEADGYELIRRLRALAPEDGGATPAVAVTAHGSPEDREALLAAGFQEYLEKPVDAAELVEVVVRLAGRAE